MESRVRTAKQKIEEAGLEDRISIEDDFYKSELSEADVIFDMMPEGKDDLKKLYSSRKHIKITEPRFKNGSSSSLQNPAEPYLLSIWQ